MAAAAQVQGGVNSRSWSIHHGGSLPCLAESARRTRPSQHDPTVAFTMLSAASLCLLPKMALLVEHGG